MTNPCDLSAVEARALIGAKKLSATELLESCIARIDAVDPAVNAMVARDDERAAPRRKPRMPQRCAATPCPPSTAFRSA